MKLFNYYEKIISLKRKNDKLICFVLKVNDEIFKKISDGIFSVVCLNLPKEQPESLLSDIVFFVNEDLVYKGSAKLLKLINVNKNIVWNQIKNNSYLSEKEFNKIYNKENNATISVIYDLKKEINIDNLPIKKENFIDNIGYVLLKF